MCATKARARPKKPSQRAPIKLPKARTRSGCFTCRMRKKKCDEIGPTCSGCSRNFLKCIWPESPTATLPKDFKISTCSDSSKHLQNLNNIGKNDPEIRISKPLNEIKISIKNTNTNDPLPADHAVDNETTISPIPSNLCSVLELRSYKHEIPFPLPTTISEPIDFIIDSISAPNKQAPAASSTSSSPLSLTNLISPLDESYVNHQSITELFDSLYHESIKNSPIPSDTNELYNDLLNYTPKSITIPTNLIKNPIISSFKEIFFARGCAFLSKSSHSSNINVSMQYNQAAEKHYNNSILIVSNSLPKKSWASFEHWSLYSMKNLCAADKLLGLVSENCVSNLISTSLNLSVHDSNLILSGSINENQNFDKVLFSQFLFTYPFLIYFSEFNSLLSLKSPENLFKNYNSEMTEVFLSNNISNKSTNADSDSGSDSQSQSEKSWLQNIFVTAIINIIQILTKLIWLLRMKNSIELNDLNENLKGLKSDMSLIWTTIQTAEIQFDSNNNNELIEFAKFSHMALEILLLAISDQSINSSSPIIGFYLDQFIISFANYSDFVTKNNNNSVINKMPKCFTILPLFISACASQTLNQKEFISKELYLVSRNLGFEFIESLTSAIEDSWCVEQNGGAKTFSKLISRDGFATLVDI